jgi:hypothetical protein
MHLRVRWSLIFDTENPFFWLRFIFNLNQEKKRVGGSKEVTSL